jgi:uncharacterized membrane protein
MKTWIKALTWRILATGTTILAAYLMTGEVQLSLSIGAVEAIFKIVLYVLHDKTWDRITVEIE